MMHPFREYRHVVRDASLRDAASKARAQYTYLISIKHLKCESPGMFPGFDKFDG